MTQSKRILISTLATSLLVLAGCTLQPATNANMVTNTNTTNDNANVEVVDNPNTTVSNDNTNDSNVNSDEDKNGWLTYSDEKNNFSFQYPSTYYLLPPTPKRTLSIDNGSSLVNLVDENDLGIMTVMANDTSLTKEENIVFDTLPTGQEMFMAALADKFTLPEGYCDGGGCTLPIVAYTFTKNDKYYKFIFYTTEGSITDMQQSIIETFQFSS